MKAEPRHESPYIGLMPYREEDAQFFFGRDDEREIITSNLLASRLTLLYGASGVGKSSVLRAGVVNQLHAAAQRDIENYGTPEQVVIIYDSWVKDPVEGLTESVCTAMAKILRLSALEAVPASRDLSEVLKAWTDRVGLELLIILDQFEEYFLYHPDENGEGTFAYEFPRAVNRHDLPARFLISMREDTLSRLDRFKGSIPNLFDNRLQVKHLDARAARSAITGPVQRYNEYIKASETDAFHIEPELVDEVLRQVSQVPSELSPSGFAAVQETAGATKIETPYLQLVMTRIWNEEMRKGSRTLRLDTLKDLGGAVKIVQTHLNGVMQMLTWREQSHAADFFHYLVTPVGTKVAHTSASLAEYTGKKEEQLKGVLDKLASGKVRILRNVVVQAGQARLPGYEIYHDALAPAILKWRERYNVKRAFRRTLTYAFAAAAVLVFSAVAFSFYTYRSLQHEAALEKEAVVNTVQAKAEQEKQVAVNDAAATAYAEAVALAEAKTDDDRDDEEKVELIQENRKFKELVVSDIIDKLKSKDAEETQHGLELLRKATQEGALNKEDSPQILLSVKDHAPVEVMQKAREYITKAPSVEKIQAKPPDKLLPRVYLHIQDEAQRLSARRIEGQLENKGFDAPGIENVGAKRIGTTEVRFFRQSEQPEAQNVLRILGDSGIKATLRYVPGNEDSTRIRPKHYEVWFSADAFGHTAAPDHAAPTPPARPDIKAIIRKDAKQ